MDAAFIEKALQQAEAEADPTLKAMSVASLCSALFKERSLELVVVGGSAIELLTDGLYTSGDIDLCTISGPMLTLRDRQEIMGALSGKGGPRSWKIAGVFVDLLGPAEYFARTPFRRIAGPYGIITVMKPEDLLVERILISVYPGPSEVAERCARILIGSTLAGGFEMDWSEVLRLARLPEYKIEAECRKLISQVANEFGKPSPTD